jgi:hypothetical protein
MEVEVAAGVVLAPEGVAIVADTVAVEMAP